MVTANPSETSSPKELSKRAIEDKTEVDVTMIRPTSAVANTTPTEAPAHAQAGDARGVPATTKQPAGDAATAAAPSATGGPGATTVQSASPPGTPPPALPSTDTDDELDRIQRGAKISGYEVRHIAGKNADYCVYSTAEGGVRWTTRDGFAFHPNQHLAFERFDAHFGKLRYAPLSEREGIVEALAQALYLALAYCDDPENNGEIESPFKAVAERIEQHERAARLAEERRSRLQREVEDSYRALPDRLRYAAEAQKACLVYLQEAETALLDPSGTTRAEIALTNVKIIFARTRTNLYSFSVVSLLFYSFVVLAILGYKMGLLATTSQTGERLVLGVPTQIWLWSAVGTATSMLLRAGQFAFANPMDALRWVLFRPIVGLVMGVMTYLMVQAGLIVLAGSTDTKTPALLWVIAFSGAFSDTLSVGLLERLLGKFKDVEDKRAGDAA